MAGPAIAAPNGSPEMKRTLVDEGELVLDLLERGSGCVPLRRDQRVDWPRPLDRDVWIVVRDAAFEIVVVVARLLVDDVGHVAHDAEAMREPDRAVDDVEILVAELEALPLPVARRALAQVHDDVVDRAARAAHELRGAGADLEMHPANDVRGRARVIVLRHLLGDPEIGVDTAPIALHEEAALVAEHPRLEQYRPVEPGLELLHARAP